MRLGKAQRLIAELRRAGLPATSIWLHGAMERMCRLYEEFGVDLGDLRLVGDATKERASRGDRGVPALRAQRPLEPAAARSDDRDGERVDARAPARAAAPGRAAAGDLRPRRLGRAHPHDRASRTRPRAGSPTGARRRCCAGASCTSAARGRWRWWGTRTRMIELRGQTPPLQGSETGLRSGLSRSGVVPRHSATPRDQPPPSSPPPPRPPP